MKNLVVSAKRSHIRNFGATLNLYRFGGKFARLIAKKEAKMAMYCVIILSI